MLRRYLFGIKLLSTVKTICHWTDIDKHGKCGHLPNLSEFNSPKEGASWKQSISKRAVTRSDNTVGGKYSKNPQLGT